MKENIKIIIPAFNEAESIGNVLADIPRDQVSEVVVVNNASTDQTEASARQGGATVLRETRRGYGYACLCGLEYIATLPEQEQPDIVVFLDADYSDHPEELPELLKPIREQNYDLVIGARVPEKMEKGAMLPQQIFGNKLATSLLNLLYGVKFTDLGPFRAVRYNKLKQLNMEDKTFGWTVEMQLKAAKHGMKVTEIPVSYRKRIGFSKISGTIKGTLLAGYKIIWTIFKYR